ncbi:MAG: flippase-like domain-containing protein [Microthrixaceae bacterium]|nr:flippase-like domain-containing protein [Microthrixaceae bacterium]
MSDSSSAMSDEAERLEAISEIGDTPVEDALPKNNWKSLAARLAGSIAMLAILFWRLPHVSLSDVVPEANANTFKWITIAVVIHVVAYVLQTLRWHQVSTTLGLHTPFQRMFGFLLAGEFVSNALPTSVGGDVVRVVRQGNDTGDYADAFAATGLERLTGWLVLPLISAAALILRPSLLSLGGASLAAVIINIMTVVALVGILWLAGHRRGAGRMVGIGGWRRYLGAVHLGVVAFRHKQMQVVSVLAAGVGFQFLQCLSVLCAAKALRLDSIDLIVVMAFFPPAAIIQNLPIALGGLGVREGAFVVFFGALGVADSSAIALGLLVYIVFIIASLAGAPSFVMHRAQTRLPKEKTPSRHA